MGPISEGELTDRIINWVRENRRTNGSAHVEICADTDLVATGLLDSLGVVDLFMFVEGLIGCKVDLTDVDLSEFSMPKGLSRVTLRDPHSYSLT
jgi:acyl carrier protein